jgi:hypothetical protein
LSGMSIVSKWKHIQRFIDSNKIHTLVIFARVVGFESDWEVKVTTAPEVGVMAIKLTSDFSVITLMWVVGMEIILSVNYKRLLALALY